MIALLSVFLPLFADSKFHYEVSGNASADCLLNGSIPRGKIKIPPIYIYLWSMLSPLSDVSLCPQCTRPRVLNSQRAQGKPAGLPQVQTCELYIH